MAASEHTYSFSFTGASMKFHDFMRLARYAADHKLDISQDAPDPDYIMGRPNTRTNKRAFRELLKRYQLLTPVQRKLLPDLDVNGQKQLALIGICKAYPFLRDFIVEVVREKFMALDFQLTPGDYQSFVNRKMELHPELEQFADSTVKKARQVTWKILAQAGLIDNSRNRNILPQFVNQNVINAVKEDRRDLLKLFLMTDREIKEQTA